MSVAQTVRRFIDNVDNGKLFTYDDIESDKKSVIAIELSRLNKQGVVKRLSKGKYYKPKEGFFGELAPSDTEILKSYLSAPNTYVTGLKAFNEMGLTTQVPNVITIAAEKQARRIKVKNLNIQYVRIKQKVKKEDIYLVRVLDAIESMKNIPDTTIEEVIRYSKKFIQNLPLGEVKKMTQYALKYRPKTKAVFAAILEMLDYNNESQTIKTTLNPLSNYKVGVSKNILPNKAQWKIV
jgi:hypothetical protein